MRRRFRLAAEVEIYQSGYADGYVDCATVKAAMTRPSVPRPIEPNCPAWCAVDHALVLDIDDGLRLHSRSVNADVELLACDDLEDGTRTETEIVVRAASGTTLRWAQLLALAVLDAADLLDGAA